jgi:hypothetical protein
MSRVRYLIALIALVAASACGGLEPGQTLSPSVPPVCVSFAAVQARIADLQALEGTDPTVDQIRTALVELQSAWRQMYSASRDVSEYGVDELNRAINELYVAIDLLPDNVTVRQGMDLVSDEFSAVVSAAHAVSDELGCEDLLGV